MCVSVTYDPPDHWIAPCDQSPLKRLGLHHRRLKGLLRSGESLNIRASPDWGRPRDFPDPPEDLHASDEIEADGAGRSDDLNPSILVPVELPGTPTA